MGEIMRNLLSKLIGHIIAKQLEAKGLGLRPVRSNKTARK